MRKKILSVILATVFLITVALAEAQQPKKVPRIGFVSGVGDANAPGPQVEAFRQGLRDLGYIEGKNIVIEYRYSGGRSDRIPSLVAELVQLKVDLLVLRSLPANPKEPKSLASHVEPAKS